MTKGYREVVRAMRQVRADKNTKLFLISFFCFNGGVQAILFLASTFAEKVLGFTTSGLIVLILILQILAIGGAYGASSLSGKKGNRFSLITMLVIWTLVCFMAYFVQTGLDFYLLAACVGVVMGGIQSLARATYAKYIPENTPDTASFFSFYDVLDKTSTVAGTLIFGIVEQITGNMRNSVLVLSLFFVLSILFMLNTRVRRISAPTNQ
jgi:UMF1 family MFS transporter